MFERELGSNKEKRHFLGKDTGANQAEGRYGGVRTL